MKLSIENKTSCKCAWLSMRSGTQGVCAYMCFFFVENNSDVVMSVFGMSENVSEAQNQHVKMLATFDVRV